MNQTLIALKKETTIHHLENVGIYLICPIFPITLFVILTQSKAIPIYKWYILFNVCNSCIMVIAYYLMQPFFTFIGESNILSKIVKKFCKIKKLIPNNYLQL